MRARGRERGARGRAPLNDDVSGEDGADVGGEAEGVEEGEEGEQGRVPGVTEPGLDGDRVVCIVPPSPPASPSLQPYLGTVDRHRVSCPG